MIEFQRKILFVGYGAVAECTLPIIFKHINVPAANITVMDFEDRSGKLAEWTAKGVHFVRDRVTEENLAAILAKYVGPGDLIIDLAWNIDACEILTARGMAGQFGQVERRKSGKHIIESKSRRRSVNSA